LGKKVNQVELKTQIGGSSLVGSDAYMLKKLFVGLSYRESIMLDGLFVKRKRPVISDWPFFPCGD
tara:strand:- start:364 stop:558 length:195 start_codon:yes stop_codon:yes gene_type:complete